MPTPPFRLNNIERAIFENRYLEDKEAEGKNIKTASVSRAGRRAAAGHVPESAPTASLFLQETYDVDGLIVVNEDVPYELIEDEANETETTIEEIADNAIDARKAAEQIIAEAVSIQSAKDRAARIGQRPGKKEYNNMYSVYVLSVSIERVNEGETLTYYDPYAGGEQIRTARKGQEFYALYVTRLYVQVQQ